ncbi:hypothetical protein NX801_08005 [Streptomyces sp. LP05-1]|uniref:Secreted protein n=1 Tax=Streptomyces pyxinae TaxID=2970734 RepID=A0ABT2CDX2_9ACTN|nr:hypothetical protein [Streptomyces sp. LP05-1]MCS0635605.1 hypothetical protein [Streptomyces sp. LP05-1]
MPLHVSPAPAPALRSVLAALGSSAVRDVHTPALRSVQGPLSPELPLAVHVLDIRRVPAVSGVPGVPGMAGVPGVPAVSRRVIPASGRPVVTAPAAPNTRLAGWRFLIRSGDRSVAAADTVIRPDGFAFSHFFEGPYLSSTERALLQAEALPARYQPRLLSVPELYMLTLWLHGDTEADPATGSPVPADLLVPLAPAPPGIAAHRPHRVADLLPLLTLRLAPPLLEPTA